jgi:hypothetical protein
MLRAMMRGMWVANNLNYRLLSKKTQEFVRTNVQSLLNETAVIAINCIFQMGLLGGGRHWRRGGQWHHVR